MGLVDKILLAILLLLLPAGLLFARQLSTNTQDEHLSDEEKLSRVEELLEKVAGAQTEPTADQKDVPAQIRVSSVTVSSDSAILRIHGTVPDTQAAIFVDLSVIPDTITGLGNTIAVRDPAALGWPVERFAVLPKPTGEFLFENVLDDELGTLAIQIHQLTAAMSLQYDLTNQRLKQ
jgi:hypothetical protein